MRTNGSAPRPDAQQEGPKRPASPVQLRQRAYAPMPMPAPGYATMARDSYESHGMTPQGSEQLFGIGPSSAALEVERPPSPPGPRNPWRRLCGFWGRCSAGVTTEGVQGFNQRGWLGHFIRWMPLVGAIIGCVSLYFAVRNFRLIYAQRTYSLLEQTRPILAQGLNEILIQVGRLQSAMGLNVTAHPLPPLPAEKFPGPPKLPGQGGGGPMP